MALKALKLDTTKIKKVGGTTTGAVIGACAGGPVGLLLGVGIGMAYDWYRAKQAKTVTVLSKSASRQAVRQAARGQ